MIIEDFFYLLFIFLLVLVSGFFSGSETALTAVSKPRIYAKAKKGNKKGTIQVDKDLRDTENIPISESIESYFSREIKPYYPDAWIDQDKVKIGYEVSFNRYFYNYVQPKALEIINQEIRDLLIGVEGISRFRKSELIDMVLKKERLNEGDLKI